MRTTLYIDVDDTIIAECNTGSGFDLRPNTMTYLTVLSHLFDCFWLTYWSRQDINQLMRHLYGHTILSNFRYANWQWVDGNEGTKSKFVLSGPKDFYWLEDPLCPEELKDLTKAGLSDRYIEVNPKGPNGFIEAVNKLFIKSGIDKNALKRVGAKPEWF